MKFQIRNLGPVRHARLETGDLTIICGKNNTGKTYLTYAIYGFLKSWKSLLYSELASEISGQLREDGNLRIDLTIFEKKLPRIFNRISEKYSERLHRVFNVSEDEIKNARLEILIDDYQADYENEFPFPNARKEKNSRILHLTHSPDKPVKTSALCEALSSYFLGKICFHNVFIATSERLGISLFYKELDKTKSELVDDLMKMEKNDPYETIFRALSRYSAPIKDHIDFSRDLNFIAKKKSFLSKEHPELANRLETISDGQYRFMNNEPVFVTDDNGNQVVLSMYMGSTSVRSLTDLCFYVKHLAQKNDLIIMDEPELNLHPENQIKIARFFARLVNNGICICITTHSDYIIKELNNLIMLSNDFREKDALIKKYGYKDDEILKPSQVRVYVAENNTLTPAVVDELGIEAKSFEETINKLNNVFDEIYFALQEDS